VTIGQGAVVGAGSLVMRDLEPWTVNVGAPTREIRRRPSETMLAMARELGYE
jgi:acetyltransferase-like isoleucine patch superfamily enzyme